MGHHRTDKIEYKVTMTNSSTGKQYSYPRAKYNRTRGLFITIEYCSLLLRFFQGQSQYIFRLIFLLLFNNHYYFGQFKDN
jgi:hypothetical protein